MRTLRHGLVFAVLLCGSATLSSAQNLLRNGTFDSGISPWKASNSVGEITVATLSPLDADGNPASGSIRATATSPGAFGGGVLSECIPVVAGLTYQQRYKYLIEPTNGIDVTVFAQVGFYSDSACSPGSSMIGYGGIVGDRADGAWHASLDSTDRYTAPAGARGVRLDLRVHKPFAGGSVTAHFDNVVFKVLNDCGSLDVLCLNDGRFQVAASWYIPGASGRAHAVQLTNDTGYLWFFDPTNVEVVIKVLDACGSFGRFWVFAGGLTNVEVDIIVTDLVTGQTNTYHNNRDEPFAPLQDTDAFATCP
jgi:hypothetical protein